MRELTIDELDMVAGAEGFGSFGLGGGSIAYGNEQNDKPLIGAIVGAIVVAGMNGVIAKTGVGHGVA